MPFSWKERQTAIDTCKTRSTELLVVGGGVVGCSIVAHAALFGSRARGDARPDSDTDIMIEIDPTARTGVWGYVGLKEYIARLFDGPVDVVDREGAQAICEAGGDG